ncbi:hypothetical protein I546_2127 [Mycobacterium kansasii 732]|nr:hypothetical protein I546_2127 [Mycobacterium kansasii 732]
MTEAYPRGAHESAASLQYSVSWVNLGKNAHDDVQERRKTGVGIGHA